MVIGAVDLNSLAGCFRSANLSILRKGDLYCTKQLTAQARRGG